MTMDKAYWQSQLMTWGSALVLVAFVFSLYMPGGARDVLLFLSLVVVYRERHLLVMDAGIKRIGYAMLAYILIFTVFSTDIGRSAKGAYDMLRGMLVFFVGYLLAIKLADEKKFALLTVGAAVMLAGNFAFRHEYPGFDYYGYFDNPNNSAVAIIMFTIFSLPLFASYPAHKVFWAVGGTGFALGAYLLVLSNARGAWLGLFCALGALMYLLPSIKRHHRIAMSIALVCALVLIVLWANAKGFSLSERDRIWMGLLSDTWVSRPLLGYGLNRIKDVLVALGLPTQTAHNMFLEIFVASGLVGLLYMVAFMVGVYRYLTASGYSNSTLLYIGVMGMTAYLVMAQFDLKLSSFTFMASMSLFIGLIYSQRLTRHQS